VIVGTCRIELFIAGSQSLKDKRQVVKSLTHKIAHRFNVSVSEIDHHDLRQRGTIAVANVGPSRHEVERLLNRVAGYAQSASGEDIVRCVMFYFDPEKDI
jgi:uncharacterized protein YlxP (DUF503 family)